MVSASRPLRWARRVEQEKIRRLYETDARGVVDGELIDDVGYALLARCESILIATEAHAGRPTCLRCRTKIQRAGWDKDEVLRCEACGWETTWRAYHQTYRRKQLHGGGATPAFASFARAWPEARAPRDKMIVIDTLLHAMHVSLVHEVGYGRAAVVNVIEGTHMELLAFLDKLAYGDLSTPGTRERRDAWRASVAGDAGELGRPAAQNTPLGWHLRRLTRCDRARDLPSFIERRYVMPTFLWAWLTL